MATLLHIARVGHRLLEELVVSITLGSVLEEGSVSN
jgi:hypothetical protein